MEEVVTRFAPSPTGMLHIGGARTALFNYLFAKHHCGKFLLRIEDTDTKRSNQKSKEKIISGLQWLGLQWDGEIVYQSSRSARHLEVAQEMIQNGTAYYAHHNSKNDNGDDVVNTASQNNTPNNDRPAIYFKVPAGVTKVSDMVHGTIHFDNSNIKDIVLVRSDGTPTYMMAVVVDDIDMNITHVIRGDDHLSNTPKQIMIYNAINATIPKFAHIPLIHNIAGQKLSKRQDAIDIESYMDMGYISEALCNYLMQLGWHYDEKIDILSIESAVKIFNFNKVGKSPSRFDFNKLRHINLQHIKYLSEVVLLEKILIQLKNKAGRDISTIEEGRILAAIHDIKKHSTIIEIVEVAALYLDDFHQYVSEKSKDLINKNQDRVSKLRTFVKTLDVNNFVDEFNAFLDKNEWQFSDIGPILRSLLIGRTDSVSLKSIVTSLGKDEIIRRVEMMCK